jgi:hypothetical protein
MKKKKAVLSPASLEQQGQQRKLVKNKDSTLNSRPDTFGFFWEVTV